MLIDFREREKHQLERERSISGLLHTLQLGTEPATQARALTRNQTHNLLACGTTLQPTEPHPPGLVYNFLKM